MLKCKKCGHTWEPRKKHPRCCPACKSYTWDKARKEEPAILIHNSPQKESFVVSREKGRLFNGIFTGFGGGGMGGEHRHAVLVDPEKIASHADIRLADRGGDIESFLDIDPDLLAVEDGAIPSLEMKDIEYLVNGILENGENQALDNDEIDEIEQRLMDEVLFVDNSADLAWEIQRLRGAFAKSKGFDAVEMYDEEGVSVLVFPGREHERRTIPIGENESVSDAQDRIVSEWKKRKAGS